MANISEAVVIGAGVLGCSVAYHLAREGIKTVVLDKDNICSGTSATGSGAINIQSKGPGFYLELNMKSAAYYPAFIGELEGDVQYVPSGGSHIAETEKEMADRVAFMEEQKKTPGFKVAVFYDREALQVEPNLSPHIAGLTFCPHDAKINPFKLNWAMARTARKLGVVFETDTEVLNVARVSGEYRITTNRDVFIAPRIISCAGTGTREMGAMLGVDLNVEPLKGQMMATEPLPPVFRHLVSTLSQTAGGNVIIGSTAHYVKDTQVIYKDIKAMASRAMRLVPVLRRTSIIRAWAGIRPFPTDGYPIIGEIPDYPGFYVASSHSGITLTPVIGKIISQLVSEGKAFYNKNFAVNRLYLAPEKRKVH